MPLSPPPTVTLYSMSNSEKLLFTKISPASYPGTLVYAATLYNTFAPIDSFHPATALWSTSCPTTMHYMNSPSGSYTSPDLDLSVSLLLLDSPFNTFASLWLRLPRVDNDPMRAKFSPRTSTAFFRVGKLVTKECSDMDGASPTESVLAPPARCELPPPLCAWGFSPEFEEFAAGCWAGCS